MELQIIQHKDILFRDLLRAIDIKKVSWPFSIESQLKWMIDNMRDDDNHVFLRDGKTDIAYMTLSPVNALVNDKPLEFMGVGCVCSRSHGTGAGDKLMKEINCYLLDRNYKGLLFCKENLVGFYSRYNWMVIPPEKVRFKEPLDEVFSMVFNCEIIERFSYFDRFF